MTTAQRPPKRRSGRLGAENDEERAMLGGDRDVAQPTAKRVKRDDGRLINGMKLSQSAGDGSGMTMTKRNRKLPSPRCLLDHDLIESVPYDEDDDGFAFTRTRSKRIAAATPKSIAPEAIPHAESAVEKKRPARRKKSFSTPVAPAKALLTTRRSTRLSNGTPPPIDAPQEHSKKPAVRTATIASRRGRTPERREETHEDRIQRSTDTTKIALPFSDTPVMKRNKEFRKEGSTRRRSSIGLRGRRASSLIDSGSTALPHAEVPVEDFYRHISEEGLPEPRRMRQLLTWCGTRALIEKPTYSRDDGNTRLAARVIQEELLKDFSSRSELSDWFGREETAPEPPSSSRPKVPNPRNIANAAKAVELEAEILRLQAEKASWDALARPPTSPQSHDARSEGPIDSELLDSSEQALILSTLLPSSSDRDPPSEISTTPLLLEITTTLRTLASGLEFKIDRFADGIHALGEYQRMGERVAGRVLALGAERLEERSWRERGIQAGAAAGEGPAVEGVREVLRALGAVMKR